LRRGGRAGSPVLRGHVPVAEVVAAAPDEGLLLSEFVLGELASAALAGRRRSGWAGYRPAAGVDRDR